jgi:hypothetical protein
METNEMAKLVYDNFRDKITHSESVPVVMIQGLIESIQDKGIEVVIVTEPMTRILVEGKNPHWHDIIVKSYSVNPYNSSIVVTSRVTKIYLYQWHYRPDLIVLDNSSVLRMLKWED